MELRCSTGLHKITCFEPFLLKLSSNVGFGSGSLEPILHANHVGTTTLSSPFFSGNRRLIAGLVTSCMVHTGEEAVSGLGMLSRFFTIAWALTIGVSGGQFHSMGAMLALPCMAQSCAWRDTSKLRCVVAVEGGRHTSQPPGAASVVVLTSVILMAAQGSCVYCQRVEVLSVGRKCGGFFFLSSQQLVSEVTVGRYGGLTTGFMMHIAKRPILFRLGRVVYLSVQKLGTVFLRSHGSNNLGPMWPLLVLLCTARSWVW